MSDQFELPLKVVVYPVRLGEPYRHDDEIRVSDSDCVHLTIQDKNRKPIVNVKLTPNLAEEVADLIRESVAKLDGVSYRQY